MSDCTLRHALGAHVVGGLAPDETDALERHLAACATCRTDLAELEGAPVLLDLARDAPPPVPHRVRDRLVAEAARRRERRRWALAAVAGIALLVVAAGLVGTRIAQAPQPPLAVPLEAVDPDEVSGWVWIETRDQALSLRVEVEGLEALAEPEVYEAWLYTAEGRIVSIGQFDHPGGDVVALEATAAGALGDYAGLWVTAEPDRRDPGHDGPTVVRARIPDAR